MSLNFFFNKQDICYLMYVTINVGGGTHLGTISSYGQKYFLTNNNIFLCMNDNKDPVSYVMFVEINLVTSGNTWTASTITNKSYPGPLPDVLGPTNCRFGFRGTHLNLDAHFFLFSPKVLFQTILGRHLSLWHALCSSLPMCPAVCSVVCSAYGKYP